MAVLKSLPRIVIALGFVSFLTDVSSEMIYPLLPAFLAGTLALGPSAALALGVIEGVAEATASILKLASGLWADRVPRRKPFLLAGYGLAGAARPLIGLAGSWPAVLALRFLDRVGKGIRSSPRDALIADVTPPDRRGTAYGVHRAMDHAGAVVGPLVAAGLLAWGGFALDQVFVLAAIPAALVMVVLALAVQEPAGRVVAAAPPGRSPLGSLRESWRDCGPEFRRLLLALGIFTLGNSADAFLLLRLRDAGVAAAWIAVLWSLHHVVKMVCTAAGGRLADRWGPRRMIVAGWIVYALVYAAFGLVAEPTVLIAVFLAYGMYFGLVEPAEKAWVSRLAPAAWRGTAFGFYHGVIGLAALPASVAFGLLWAKLGAPVAFFAGAGLALAAAVLVARVGDAEAGRAAAAS